MLQVGAIGIEDEEEEETEALCNLAYDRMTAKKLFEGIWKETVGLI
jgi:hypothetical protein